MPFVISVLTDTNDRDLAWLVFSKMNIEPDCEAKLHMMGCMWLSSAVLQNANAVYASFMCLLMKLRFLSLVEPSLFSKHGPQFLFLLEVKKIKIH